MHDFLDALIPVGLIGAVIALLWFAVTAGIEERKRWEAFRVAHECRVVERVPGTAHPVVTTGVSANGQVVTSVGVATTPARTAWLCNDGVTYWR